ncbi:ureidoglycolate lyase [Oricola sp.]|uniref:ureidoglycolate lyase n=1 Tax=Oricola sp. TaxID=1979950 RepID=UPI003BAA1E54
MDVTALPVEPLTRQAFAPFGDVVETAGAELRVINGGTTQRFHDLAEIDVGASGGRAIISVFRGQPFDLPIEIAMMERHPLGSQLFFPVSSRPFLAVVSLDDGGKPAPPRAFLCPPGIGVNYARNVWHHPLLALQAASDFIVVDRDGPGINLEEKEFSNARYRIEEADLRHKTPE